jgi:predicted AAA+ superfamily ATPase
LAFSRKAKRKLIRHQKFYYFDTGVFRAIRPTGPLDSDAELDGPAMETLVFQDLRAINDYLESGYLHYGGSTPLYIDDITVLPIEQAFRNLKQLLRPS